MLHLFITLETARSWFHLMQDTGVRSNWNILVRNTERFHLKFLFYCVAAARGRLTKLYCVSFIFVSCNRRNIPSIEGMVRNRSELWIGSVFSTYRMSKLIWLINRIVSRQRTLAVCFVGYVLITGYWPCGWIDLSFDLKPAKTTGSG